MSSGYEDLRLVKMMLTAAHDKGAQEHPRTQELILFGASLEALRDVKEKVERINERLSMMDIKNEREVKSIEKQEKSLLEQIKSLSPTEREALLEVFKPTPKAEPILEREEPIQEHYNIAEIAPIESVAARKKIIIKETISKYNKITSSQLSRIIGLSRTRCNEYLKELELSNELTAFTEDKKRYYQLKN